MHIHDENARYILTAHISGAEAWWVFAVCMCLACSRCRRAVRICDGYSRSVLRARRNYAC
eukprot:8924110-Pyramimonas_sp.AAC.1